MKKRNYTQETVRKLQGSVQVEHQREVGVGYFDLISEAVGATSTVANKHSTEADQF